MLFYVSIVNLFLWRNVFSTKGISSGTREPDMLSPAAPPEPQSKRCDSQWDRNSPVYPKLTGHRKGGLSSVSVRLKGEEVGSKDRLSNGSC
jgi:hypothetical protein